MRRRTLAGWPLGVLPLGAAASPDAEVVQAAVDDAIHPLMARHDVPGMSVGLCVAGRALVFHHGVASRAGRDAVTDETLFEIGSVTKTFTSTLAALAQVTGRLSLQDPPGRHLPALQGRPINRASLLHLGTHTAGGLPLQFPDDVADDRAAMAYLRGWASRHAPGTVRQYSNPGLGLLGAATATAMGDDFAQLIGTHLLRPLGMRHTHFDVPAAAMATYAWGEQDGWPKRMSPGPMDRPTYGLKTTAADLLRWVQAQLDPHTLDAALRDAVALTQVGRFRAGPMVQGLGWEQFALPMSLQRLRDGNSAQMIYEPQPVVAVRPAPVGTPRLFDKTGSTGGFGAYVAFVPSQSLGLVMLANRNIPIPARVDAAWAILNRLWPGLQPQRTSHGTRVHGAAPR